MKKDKTIIDFIEKAKRAINFDLIEIVDYWNGDLCAVGFKKENKLIYVSTYSFCNEEKIKYDYDLEYISKPEKNISKVLKTGRSVSEEEVIRELLLLINEKS